MQYDWVQPAREDFEAKGKLYPPAPKLPHSRRTIASVECFGYGIFKEDSAEIVIYVHGGGFFLGSNRTHGAWTSHLARHLNLPVLLIEYALAPENPFPAALNQVASVIGEIQKLYPAAKIALLGDSAGGNIALAAGLKLKEAGEKQPDCYVLYSPWLDLECKNPSFERNKTLDLDLTRDGLVNCAAMYASGHSLTDPLISPLNADFAGLNPVLILCGTNEILEDDSLMAYERLKDCGVQTSFQSMIGEGHSWSFYDVHCPGSKQAFELVAHFLSALPIS